MIVVCDTETTGLDPAKDRVVEFAVVEVSATLKKLAAYRTSLVNPGRSIPAAASGVHHLIAKDVKNAPKLEDTYEWMLPPLVDAYVAHNAAFDRGFLVGMPDQPWVCTMKCAQKIWPDEDSYSNQALRYMLEVQIPELQGRGAAPHSALYDALCTAGIFLKMLEKHSLEELIAMTADPLVRKMPFGKHKGMLFQDIPKDYIKWLSRQNDLSPDLKYTLEYYLG